MFLKNFLDTKMGQDYNKIARTATTYPFMFDYWREKLFERVMRLFVWGDTGDTPPKEIELRLLVAGHCGITKISNSLTQKKFKGDSLTAMFGSFYGVSEYQDEWHNYNVRCPITAGSRTIGKDIIVIDNTSTRNSIMPLIIHYASILAHIDVTLVNLLINARDSGGVPVVGNEKQKQSMRSYLTNLYNGTYGTVTDKGSLGIEFMGARRGTEQNIRDVMEVKTSVLKSFWSDIGVRNSFEKKNNAVEAEVTADTSLLRFNLSDMEYCREKGVKAVNELFGTNWKFHISDQIDYNDDEGMEDDLPIQSDNMEVDSE